MWIIALNGQRTINSKIVDEYFVFKTQETFNVGAIKRGPNPASGQVVNIAKGIDEGEAGRILIAVLNASLTLEDNAIFDIKAFLNQGEEPSG